MLNVKQGTVTYIYNPSTWDVKARNQKFKVIHSSVTSSCHFWATRDPASEMKKEKKKKKIFDAHFCFLELKDG